MDLQKMFDLINENYKLKAASSYNLGDFIKDLDNIDSALEILYEGKDIDFLSMYPTDFDSWRGSYNCLMLGYEPHYDEPKNK